MVEQRALVPVGSASGDTRHTQTEDVIACLDEVKKRGRCGARDSGARAAASGVVDPCQPGRRCLCWLAIAHLRGGWVSGCAAGLRPHGGGCRLRGQNASSRVLAGVVEWRGASLPFDCLIGWMVGHLHIRAF